VTKQNFSLVMGGSFIKSEVFDRLTEHDQKVLRETAIQSGKVNARLTRRDDDRAYEALVKRGIVQVDLSPHQAEWDAISKKTRENLAGRVYSKSLLEAVERAVAP
jgi:TRAP-type C4-dicarboxylate transport system substrate-binding protein